MVFGALVAAADDLSFVLSGYVFIMLNNLSTAAKEVYIKQKLDNKDLGE
jgi:solute carrier family 35 protein